MDMWFDRFGILYYFFMIFWNWDR